MNTQTEKLSVILDGRFALLDVDGADITPPSAKAQGVIALLAMSEGFERSRLGLQQKLWSDRGHEQAASSLRQSLTLIRRALGDHADLLASNRQIVGLDPDRIKVGEITTPMPDFLEGIPVRDPEFLIWLEEIRTGFVAAPPQPGPGVAARYAPSLPIDYRRKIAFRTMTKPSDPLGLLEAVFVDGAARSLDETMSVNILIDNRHDIPPDALLVNVQSFHSSTGHVGLRVAITSEHDQHHIWSGSKIVNGAGAPPVDDPDILMLGNQLIAAIADRLLFETRNAPDRSDASLLARKALHKIFTMKAANLVEADEMLARAFEIDPRGIYAAWRAQLRVIQHVERHTDDLEMLVWETEDLCYKAMELEPSNSMVLASVANARLVMNDNVIACYELARKSVELNPANPMAWDSLSTAKLYAGQHEEAHMLAAKAQRLGSTSPHKFWWDMGRCLTAALTGRGEEALSMASVSSAMAPHFRPALRYLTALYASQGKPAEALMAARQLKRIEPDFSLDKMANDPAYPIGVLRRSGLLDQSALSSLIGDE